MFIVVNITANRVSQVSSHLRNYEGEVQEAAEAGLLISFVADSIYYQDSDLPPVTTERWSVLQAVFFASTVLTTIGRPNSDKKRISLIKIIAKFRDRYAVLIYQGYTHR